jgi:putative thioredoxin
MAEAANVYDVTAENFREKVVERSRSVPVLVDFWADWCQPCRILMPVLAKLADELGGKLAVAKVDTEEQRELAAHFGVRSLPTVKLFKDGRPVDEFMGALPESQIRAFLDRHIPRESDALVARAYDLVQRGDLEEALSLVRQASDSDPDNPRALFALARLQAASGDLEAAEASLARLPAEERDAPEVSAFRGQLVFERLARDAPPTAALEASLAANPADSESQYRLAARRVIAGDYEGALDLLLSLMLRDRAYGDDAARRAMLEVFGILGAGSGLAKRYRARMFNALH